jgi:thioredoxin-like negative regulator of GroEL
MRAAQPIIARLALAMLAGLWLCACEVITVDPHETDLTGPYIPIVSPLGRKIGELPVANPDEERARRVEKHDRQREERGEKFLNRVQELLDKNDCEQAEPLLSKHLSRSKPTNKARAVYYLALCRQKAGNIDAAIDLLRSNLNELTPNTPFGIEQLRLMVDLQKQKNGEQPDSPAQDMPAE